MILHQHKKQKRHMSASECRFQVFRYDPDAPTHWHCEQRSNLPEADGTIPQCELAAALDIPRDQLLQRIQLDSDVADARRSTCFVSDSYANDSQTPNRKAALVLFSRLPAAVRERLEQRQQVDRFLQQTQQHLS
jgi:hypothetical protein